LKTITGTATEEDVNRAIAAVDELRKSQARAYNHWQKTETDIASLTHILNDRLVALQRLEYNNRLGIQRHFVELSNTLSDLYQMNALVPATMQRLASFSDALVHMSSCDKHF